MKVEVLGTGDCFSFIRYNSSFIVSQDDFCLAIDCPHPYLKILFENSISTLKNINDVVITHLHGDHISGLDTFLFYKKFVENKVINVYSTQHKELWEHLRCSMGKNFDKDISQDTFYNAVNLPANILPFEIEVKPTFHYIPGNALLIKGEKTVGFSGDTGYDPELIEWLNQADLIFHETGPAPGHTEYHLLLNKLKEIDALHKTRLTHYSDSLIYFQIPVAISKATYNV